MFASTKSVILLITNRKRKNKQPQYKTLPISKIYDSCLYYMVCACFASNILFAGRNSMPCKMFIFLLIVRAGVSYSFAGKELEVNG